MSATENGSPVLKTSQVLGCLGLGILVIAILHEFWIAANIDVASQGIRGDFAAASITALLLMFVLSTILINLLGIERRYRLRTKSAMLLFILGLVAAVMVLIF